jgi:RhtB (resistance to homoserine/threonine) family protein
MSAFLTIALIHFVAVASPGPDFVIVTRNTLSFSRVSGIWTALGVALANLVHVGYCLLGIGLLISKSIVLFNTIKFLGAGYLIFIGWRALTHKKGEAEITTTQISSRSISTGNSFRLGFLTSVLNPKASLFYLALFTQVISPMTPMTVLIGYSIYLGAATFAWFAGVASFFSLDVIRRGFSRIQSSVERVMGGLLILLGMRIALARQK